MRRCCGLTERAAMARWHFELGRRSIGPSPPTRLRSRSATSRSPATAATCGPRSPRWAAPEPARTGTKRKRGQAMFVSAEAPPRAGRVTVVAHEGEPANERQVAAPRPGPLLAVCGVCGGAGASTLAYLFALAGARETTQPVL